jgi:magnesium chelatase subunit I
MDRVEEIPIGPPSTLAEEIKIGLMNISLKSGAILPIWHLKILARTVRYARKKEECRIASRIELEPSCRATIKLFDHLRASAIRNGHKAAMFGDYGERYEVVKLGMRSRMELDYDEGTTKDEIIEKLVEEAINRTCSEIYTTIPREEFGSLMEDIALISNEEPINVEENRNLKDYTHLWKTLLLLSKTPDEINSALEILLESIQRCTGLVDRISVGRYAYAGYNS